MRTLGRSRYLRYGAEWPTAANARLMQASREEGNGTSLFNTMAWRGGGISIDAAPFTGCVSIFHYENVDCSPGREGQEELEA
jgi:hypothetical protein